MAVVFPLGDEYGCSPSDSDRGTSKAASDLGPGMECPVMCLPQTSKKLWTLFLNSSLAVRLLSSIVRSHDVAICVCIFGELIVPTVGGACGVLCVCVLCCVCARVGYTGPFALQEKHACVRVAICLCILVNLRACVSGAEFCL